MKTRSCIRDRLLRRPQQYKDCSYGQGFHYSCQALEKAAKEDPLFAESAYIVWQALTHTTNCVYRSLSVRIWPGPGGWGVLEGGATAVMPTYGFALGDILAAWPGLSAL